MSDNQGKFKCKYIVNITVFMNLTNKNKTIYGNASKMVNFIAVSVTNSEKKHGQTKQTNRQTYRHTGRPEKKSL